MPKLHALSPSTEGLVDSNDDEAKRAASADASHVVNILIRTQSALSAARCRSLRSYHDDDEGTEVTTSTNSNNNNNDDERRMTALKRREIDALSMKIVILKRYLKEVAKLEDEFIPSMMPMRRRGESNNNNNHYGMADDYYGTMHDRDVAIDVASHNGYDVTGDNGSKKKRRGSDTMNHDKQSSSIDGSIAETSANRLDRIKNGQLFVEGNLHDNSSSNHSKRKRRTVMQMKAEMRIRSGSTPLKTIEEERFDAERSKKRREQRRKRRLARQHRALGLDTDDNDDDGDGDNDGLMKQRGDENKEVVSILKKRRHDMKHELSAGNDNLDKTPEMGDTIANSKQNGVCWDANLKMDGNTDLIASNGTNDNNNSKQNGVCWDTNVKMDGNTNKQASDNSSSNNNNTTSPQKRTYTKVMCPICQIILTCEDGDTKPDEFLSLHIEQCQRSKASSTRGRSLRKRTKPSVVDVDDDVLDCYEEAASSTNVRVGEADVTLFDDQVSSDNDDDRNKSTPKQNPEHHYNHKEKIDDMDEFDYEDRVDDWIEHGIDRMNVMSERDSNEAPPGAVVYEGGLEVPAWINDRLFPYQRTGVRWLWELHCQGAGGVVGDEMGLGKTVQVSAFVGAMAANRYLDSVLVS